MYYRFGCSCLFFFFFQAEDGIRDLTVTGVQTCALPILFEPATKQPAGRDVVLDLRNGGTSDASGSNNLLGLAQALNNADISALAFTTGNPQLGPLASHGGPTQTMLNSTGSPALDGVACTAAPGTDQRGVVRPDRKSTRLNSSHSQISYAVFCLKKKNTQASSQK